MPTHRKTITLILILVVSLSCKFFVPNEPPPPLTVTEPPLQTEPPSITVTAATEPPCAPTDTPAATGLNATGPYVVYGGAGVWISNPDGSFLTQITDLNINIQDLRRAISPRGDRLALIVSNDEGLDLVEVKIPSGQTRTIVHLFSITHEELMSDPLSARAFTTYALRDYDNLAWQPGEGKLLAFMGAMNGSTSDLYVYDTETEKITQLTDGPSQGVFPTWSPDGNYILHYGVSWRGPFGGAITGHDHLDGVWAVGIADEEVISMPKPQGIPLRFLGWQDDSHYLADDEEETCGARNIHSVDVTNGKKTSIMDLSFYSYVDYSPENDAFVFSGAPGCPESLGEGTFLLLPGQTTPVKLTDKRAWEVDWMPESQVFFAYPEALFSADGKTRYDPPVYDASYHPAVSKKGYQAWEVIENQRGRVEVKVPGGDWQTILEEGTVGQMIWDPISGETLLMALREGPLYAASYPDFTPREVGDAPGVDQILWLP